MKKFYVTAVHYHDTQEYAIGGVHFTLNGAISEFRYLDPLQWVEIQKDCWQNERYNVVCTVQAFPLEW